MTRRWYCCFDSQSHFTCQRELLSRKTENWIAPIQEKRKISTKFIAKFRLPCSSGSNGWSVGQHTEICRVPYHSPRLQKIYLYFHHWPQGGLSTNTNRTSKSTLHLLFSACIFTRKCCRLFQHKRAIFLHYERGDLLDQTMSSKNSLLQITPTDHHH